VGQEAVWFVVVLELMIFCAFSINSLSLLFFLKFAEQVCPCNLL